MADAGSASARAYAVATRSDNSVLAAGCTNQGGTTGDDFMLVHFNSNGELDNNFGSGGGALTDIGGGDDCAYGIIKQKDGKIVLLGETNIVRSEIPSRDFGLVRYQSNGNLDNSFSGDGKANTEFRTNDDAVARAGIQQKDGKLVVVGSSAPLSGGDRDFAIARYLSDGSLDSSFGSGGRVLTDIEGDDDVATGVIQQWDNKLLVAGNSSNGDGVLVRYNTNGTLDTSFGVGGILITSLSGGLVINGLALQGDGQVVAAGFSFASGNYVMATLRYLFDDDDNDGVLDTADNCQYVANASQDNHDADALGDACDDDDDNDGVLDVNDAFPFDPSEWEDTDGDGIGNNADPDDDNDGVLDGDDPFPLDPFLLARVIGAKGDKAGYSVALVGDVNGDGFADILVGKPKADVVLPSQTKKSLDVGEAVLLSGQDALAPPLHVFSGAAKGDEFGTAVVALGDVNGDSVPDFAIGAPKTDEVDIVTGKIVKKDRGSVTVYSGADFSEIFTLNGDAAGDNFGAAIAAAGDVVGSDSRADFIVGAPKADGVDPITLKPMKDAGAAYLYSGIDGTRQHTFTGAAKGDNFGASLAGGADLDQDGVADIAIGAYRHDPLDPVTNKPRKDAGSVYVYSSASPYSFITQLDGQKAGDNFGFSLAVVNEGQDAFRDLLVGIPRADITVGSKKLLNAGKVSLFNLAAGIPLYNVQADTPQAGALFGSSVAAAGDVNASGSESFVVGAPKTDTVVNGKKLKDAGQVVVHSAAAGGAVVFAVDGKIAGGQAGFSVAGGKDFNNDANDDILIGSPFALFNKLSKAGIAEVISGKEASAAWPP